MASTVRQSFDPRRNSIGFLRWLLATAVLFSHAGPLAGFYGSKNLGTQWSDEQSFGGVAVAGFFFLSGFLITKSRMGRSTIVRFLWRRVLRIMPAFWAALIATAFLLAPLCWWHVHHTLHGYFSASAESPLTYFSNNMWLHMTQHNIAQMGSTLPLAHCCGYDWNGSAWTLIYEFSGYLLIGVLGLVGFLGYRRVALAIFAFWVLLNTVTFLSIPVHVTVVQPLLSNFFAVMLLTPFLFGMVFALYDDKIVIDDRLALAAAGVAFYTYFIAHGWNIYGQFAFLYLVMWCAIRLPITNWERFGDLSYGIYIYAWPIMQVASFFHLYTRGWLAYHVGVLVACHIAAYLSWHLLEKRALALKNWTPQWLLAVQRRAAPSVDRIRTRVDHPDFSSTRFAASRRGSGDAEPATADLVTHDPGARVRLRGPHHGPDPSAPPVGSGRPVRRGRLVVAGSAGLVALLVFVAMGWGLPAVYRHRYEPRTLAVSQTGLTGPGGHFAAAHPVPTAAQDAAFAANEPGGDKQTAVLGRDGYYFFGDAYVHNFSEAMGRRYYSPQEVVGTAETLTAQRQWLAARGIAFDFVVAPAKWDIYSDKLPAWTDGQRLPTIYDQLNAYDPNLLVDLRPALQSGRITGDTYSRLNSHWTPYGAYLAYQELATQLARTVPGIGALRAPTLAGVTTTNADNEFASIVSGTGTNNWVEPQFASPLPGYHLHDSAGTDADVPGDHGFDMTTMPLTTTSPSAGNSARALILCDSTVTAMSPYLAEAFGSTMMVRHFLDDPASEPNLPALVDQFKPTVVIVMMTEREFDAPITNQLPMWQAATAFDAAPSSSEKGLAVTRPGSSITLPIPVGLDQPLAVRLVTDASASGTLAVSAGGTSGQAPTAVPIAKGANQVYFQVPAHTRAITITGPVGSLSATTASARALTS